MGHKELNLTKTITLKLGPVAQLVASLTANPGVVFQSKPGPILLWRNIVQLVASLTADQEIVFQSRSGPILL